MTDNNRKLGIIAGGGDIPAMLINHCLAHHIDFAALAIEGNADTEFFSGDKFAYKWIRIGQAGSGFKYFADEKVTDVVMIGTIRRPGFLDLIPDLRTTAFFAHVGAKALGDDGILRAVTSEIEKEGMHVKGIHEIMPELLIPQGIVLGVEGIEGTDELIKRCQNYRRKGEGGVLVKLRKPQQDMRIDLPTIGSRTIELAHQSGLSGVVVHTGNGLIINQDAAVALADKYGMYIMGVNPDEFLQN